MWMVVFIGLIVGKLVESWDCPIVGNVSCSCDIAHTLRCTGSQSAFPIIASSLRKLSTENAVSLLDCTIQDLTHIKGPLLKGVSLHGLVVSSGGLRSVDETAFNGLKSPLQALGFPNNQLKAVPILAISHLSKLTRLDLSHNCLQSLSNHSFQGLAWLRFLDLSVNQLSSINPTTFIKLRKLKILRLQSNNLNKDVISQLQGLLNLEELDLAANSISGPLNSMSFPRLPKLRNLDLAHNQISSIPKGAFAGLDSLEALSLEHNMIDVLEDHAFRALSTLKSLVLGHNRIVAVSESSLAHLKGLTSLDLSHNFLRALTADLVSPLQNLRQLRLDDNDISMISANALQSADHLTVLTLSENPLNCDCSLAEFAKWLKNSSIESNKKSAVCATPPSLENGLVEELSASQLVCDIQDGIPSTHGQHPMPVSGTRVILRGFNFDGANISLLWAVDPVGSYYCDALFIYEELGAHEVLLESNRLNCNSSNLRDPHNLPITLETPHLKKGHRYRYCVVMVEENSPNESALVLGCSEVMTLYEASSAQILSIHANSTDLETLNVQANIWPSTYKCLVTFLISIDSKVVHQSKLNCSTPNLTVKGLSSTGPYKICAMITDVSPICTSGHTLPRLVHHPVTSHSAIVILFSLLIFTSVIIIGCKCIRHKLSQPKLHEQCFLPTAQDDLLQNSRYIKLQATTKL